MSEVSSMVSEWGHIVATSGAIQILLKITVVLAISWVIHFLLRRANPRWRVALWRTVPLAALAVPAISLFGPGLNVLPLPEREQPPQAWSPTDSQAVSVSPREQQPHVVAAVPVREAQPLRSGESLSAQRDSGPRRQPTQATVQHGVGQSSAGQPSADQHSAAGPAPRPWLRSGPVLSALYLVGLALLLVRLGCAHRTVRAMRRKARAAPSEVAHECERVARALRCPSVPEVKLLDDLGTPCLVGVRRPTVLLPASMIGSPDLPAVLAHEVSHIAERDLLWGYGLHLFSLLLWWHPLVWRLHVAHAAAAEEVSDAMASAYAGGADAYRRVLARSAVRAATQPPGFGAIPMARRSTLARRVAVLANGVGSPAIPRRYRVAAVAIAVVTLLPIGALHFARAGEVTEETVVEENLSGTGEASARATFGIGPDTRVRQVGAQLRRLELEDDATCESAAYWLGQLVPESEVAVPALLRHLKKGSEGTRRNAAKALGKLGAVRSEIPQALGAALAGETAFVREQLVFALLRMGTAAEVALPPLLAVLDELEGPLRQKALAASVVAALGSRRELAALCQRPAFKGLTALDLTYAALAAEELVNLDLLPSLRSLELPPSTTDAGLASVASLAQLEELDLGRTPVTDEGLAYLATYWRGGKLVLSLQSTPDGLEVLRQAQKFRELPEGLERLTLHAIERSSGESLAGVPLTVRVDDSKQTIPTGQDGSVTVYVPVNARRVRVQVVYRDYVPLLAEWSGPSLTELPGGYTLPLERGLAIGGRVRDEAGKPIEGATVEISVPSRDGPLRVDLHGHHALTDAQGRWRCDHVPAGATEAYVHVQHRQYVALHDGARRPSLGSLRDGSHVNVLVPGLPVTGVVVDSDGEPLRGASVRASTNRYDVLASSKTDQTGRFSLQNVRRGETVIAFEKEGFAPDLLRVVVDATLEPLRVELGAPRTLRLRVVDGEGQPVPDASVQLGGWRGYRILRGVGIAAKTTDSAGEWVWTSAPADAVEVTVTKDGFASLHSHSVTAGDEHEEVTLFRPLIVGGRVIDAETQQPIPRFSAVPVLLFNPQLTHAVRTKAVEGVDGEFRMEFRRADVEHRIRIEAPGYRPSSGRAFSMGPLELYQEFKLVKSADLRGVVRLPSGVPLPDARVLLANTSQSVTVNGDGSVGRDALEVTTDARGEFRLPAQEEDFRLAVVHDDGYAEISGAELARSPEIVLQRWARIEGRIVQEGAVPAQPLQLLGLHQYERGGVRLRKGGSTMTDGDGRFVFERVPTGPVFLRPSLSPWFESSLTSIEHVPLDVRAGETYSLSLGEGRTVTGWLDAGSQADEIEWKYGLNYLVRAEPGISLPPELRRGRSDVREGWDWAWLATQEGLPYFHSLRKHFVKVQPDGTFRIHGVEPGRYFLAFKVYEPAKVLGRGVVNAIVQRVIELEVYPSKKQETLDLGRVPVEVHHVRPGDPAPLFEAPAHGGESVALGDFRGRHVVVTFWTPQASYCLQELRRLTGPPRPFDGEERIVRLFLALSDDRDAVKQAASEGGAATMWGILPDWTIARQYGVASLPCSVLVGPDGHVIDRDLFGAKTRSVDQALAQALAR